MANELTAPIRYAVVTPRPEGRLLYEPRTIEVTPIDARHINTMDPIERVQLVKATKLPYAMPELERRFTHPLPEVLPHTLELAASLASHRANLEEERRYEAQTQELRSASEEQKKKVRATSWGKFRKTQEFSRISQEAQTAEAPLEERRRSAQAMREAVLDDFIDNLFFKRNGVNHFTNGVQDLLSQSSFIGIDVAILLKDAAERLNNLQHPEHLFFLRYKDGIDNFLQVGDAEFMKQIMATAFSPNEKSDVVTPHLTELAKALYSYYWRNVDVLYGAEEKAPTLALMYDAVFAASLTDDVTTIDLVVRDLWARIGKNLPKLEREYYGALAIRKGEMAQFGSQFIQSAVRHEPVESLLQRFNPIERGFICGKYTDVTDGFLTISAFASHMLGLTDYYDVWHKTYKAGWAEIESGKYKAQKNRFISLVLTQYEDVKPVASQLPTFFDQKTIAYMEMGHLRTDHFHQYQTATTDEERQQLIDTEAAGLTQHHATNPNFMFVLMSGSHGAETYQEMRDTLKQNKQLAHEIQYKNIWFVAENGDKYFRADDAELGEYSINSLTFYPDAPTRGARAEVRTALTSEGKPINFTIYVSHDGAFLDSDRNPLTFQSTYRIPFSNLILKRLHFITSGALAERRKRARTEEPPEEKPDEESRRSHWRTLTSTPDRVYTLTSAEAKKHAAYVKAVYGHDIYQANAERRAAGELGPSQVITFVKAIKGTREPNRIVYDPEYQTSSSATSGK